MYHSHPEDRIQITEPISRVSGSVGLGGVWEFAFLTCSLAMLMLLTWRPHLDTQSSVTSMANLISWCLRLTALTDTALGLLVDSEFLKVDLPHLCPRHPLRCWHGTWTPFVCAELNNPCWNGSSHPAQLLPAIGCMSVCTLCNTIYTLNKKTIFNQQVKGEQGPLTIMWVDSYLLKVL